MGDRMPTLTTRAGSIAYDESGDGPPLLLLAAGAHDRRDWDLVRPALASRFRTVALDWPGHGESPSLPSSSLPSSSLPGTAASPPGAAWRSSAPGFADLVEDAVTALDLAPVAVIGNSVGGFAAARLAIRHPDRVSALVLVDSGGFSPVTPLSRAFCAAMGRPGFLRAVYPAFARRYLRSGDPAARRCHERAVAIARRPGSTEIVNGIWRSFAAPEHDLRAAAGRITAPTLLVWGRRDPVIPVTVGRRLERSIPDARLAVLDAGHVPFVTHPDEFVAVAVPFLERVTSGT
jgi:pimeloyl-ACP methyl ester carboxylesterase